LSIDRVPAALLVLAILFAMARLVAAAWVPAGEGTNLAAVAAAGEVQVFVVEVTEQGCFLDPEGPWRPN